MTGVQTCALPIFATGVAWGSAAVSLPGSRMPTPADVAAIAVTSTPDPDLALVLTD